MLIKDWEIKRDVDGSDSRDDNTHNSHKPDALNIHILAKWNNKANSQTLKQKLIQQSYNN